MRQGVSIGVGYLVVTLVFTGLWARMIVALRSHTPFIGYNYGVPFGTRVGLAILIVATLVVIATAFAHAATAFQRWRSGGGL